ncbi:MAG: bifunctional alpha,alpha-trehalose-phosphate synthase (UDP-forming)/trehalose-phosphatase [Halanaerobiales bacterium]
MSRLILVSNRLPVTVEKDGKGDFNYSRSSGGLATGLSSVYQEYEGFWLGWPGITEEKLSGAEKQKLAVELEEEYNNYPLFLAEEEVNDYYYGFCNRTVWPLFHYFTRYTHFPEKFWQAYKQVNKKFFAALKDNLKENDNLWIHDYHLMLLPELIREEFPGVNIGFFLHIPFPSFEIFRILPWREEILNGLLGADLIGFHTYGYVRHFLSSVLRILGYKNDVNQINLDGRKVKVDLFPMGIDYQKFSETAQKPAVQEQIEMIKEKTGDTRLILSVDRMDYTKGIPERLEAFDYFLEQNPEYRGEVTLFIVAVPSRTKIEKYEEMKVEVSKLVGEINGKYGKVEWMPVRYLFQSVPFEQLVALYNYADVCLVTPLRDGMNLVSKEFLASSREKGVLILSEMAGSSYELGHAITITPTRKEEIAASIRKALEMEEEEQRRRLQLMKKRLKSYNVEKWAHSFVDMLASIENKERNTGVNRFDVPEKTGLLEDYKNAEQHMVIIDYDIFNERERNILRQKLNHICREERNSLILLTGDSRERMDEQLNDLNCNILAEYGDCFYNGRDWQAYEQPESPWSQEVAQILRLHKENTPGSRIQKRANSLRWNYQRSEPELSELRKKELKDTLNYFSKDLYIDIFEGEGFLEVKRSSSNINETLYKIIHKYYFDFFLLAGNLNRYLKIEEILPEETYIFEINSSQAEKSYKLVDSRDVLKLIELLP